MGKALGRERITVSSTAIGFTDGANQETANTWQLKGVSKAVCRVENAEIRITTSGTPVAGSGGLEKAAGDEFNITGYDDLESFLAIRTGGSDGVLEVIYEGDGGV